MHEKDASIIADVTLDCGAFPLGIAIPVFRDPASLCNTEIPVLRRPNTGLFGIGEESIHIQKQVKWLK